MHLTDCFIDVVAYVMYFRKDVAVQQPRYEQVRADIERLLAQGEGFLQKSGFTRDDFDQARFVICAWIDETILNSSWDHKSKWQTEQLQRVYYNVTDAGNAVFERLNTLGFQQRDVREVYYLCLALGFAGRYGQPGDEILLDQLKTSNLKLLLGSSVGLPSLERMELFPESQPGDDAAIAPQKQRFRFSSLTLAGLIGPVALFVLLLLVYRFTLSGMGESILRTIP